MYLSSPLVNLNLMCGSPSCAVFLKDAVHVLTYMLNWLIRQGAEQLLQ